MEKYGYAQQGIAGERKGTQTPVKQEVYLLDIESVNEAEWFETFTKISNEVTQVLVLIKVMLITELINVQEAENMKFFIFMKSDQAKSLVAPFIVNHALDKFRENFRGILGLPRT
jgi:hypothetical protein